MSIFDFLGTPSSKTSPECSPVTQEKTSDVCWKSLQGSSKQTLLFLDLSTRRDDRSDGLTQDTSSVTTGASLGEPWMHSTGAYLRDGNESVSCATTTDSQHLRSSCVTVFNVSEMPTRSVESRLSWILETDADERYNLSEKACQGILNRASRRGKALPEILHRALKDVISRAATLCRSDADVTGGQRSISSDRTECDSFYQSDSDAFQAVRN